MKIKPNTVVVLMIILGFFAININKSTAADTSSNQPEENASSIQDDTTSKAEIARESYERSDASPVGSWASGCSPQPAAEDATPVDEEDCLPQNTQEK
jgi:hypothetical protein